MHEREIESIDFMLQRIINFGALIKDAAAAPRNSCSLTLDTR